MLKLNPDSVKSVRALNSDEAPEVKDEETPEEPKTKYKFGTTQTDVPEDSPAYQAIREMQNTIPDEALAGDGKDIDVPHITVRYGLKTGVTPELREFIEAQSPFEAKLGKTASFPPSEHSDGAAPIIAPVVSDELHRLNKEIDTHGDFEPSSFPDYRPHVTIAYVKPELAKQYEGMDGVEGKTFPINSISVGDRDGNKTDIELKGDAPDTEEDTPSSDSDENTEEGNSGQAEVDTKEHAPNAVLPVQGGTVIASAPIQNIPVTRTSVSAAQSSERNVTVPLQTALDVTPVVTKRILPLNEVRAMAAGLNPTRTVKGVTELMAEARLRNPTKIVP